MAAPILPIESILAAKLKTLLAAKSELSALQMLMPEEKAQVALPLIRLQVEVIGPHPELAGSAICGIWQVQAWITVITSRSDSAANDLRTLFGHVRDVVYGERQAGYAELNSTLFKVWNIEPAQTVYTPDNEHDARTLPLIVTCAAFSAATT